MYHNHHSGGMRFLGTLAWLGSALAALAWGFVGLGAYLGKSWNIWESAFFTQNLPWIVVPAQIILGLLGLFSLICWFMCLGDEHHHDGRKH